MKLNEHVPPTKAPSEKFTGAVYLSPLHAGESPSRLIAALVHFTPGARTNWHSHPLGQTLHCTEGAGIVATRDGTVILMRPGDTVHTPAGEEHWHGAAPESLMTHLAMVEHENGQSARWLEPVSDTDYAAAHQQATR
ncbi:quercetin dioxygenase-like cupin family protein [Arthrobacter sp. PvP023]|uniref:(R)-mandelonitrile lyase n=1 Tax=Micrococcaceae TaxID=1268 RepID=UPI001AE316FE|nr:cupin domain-containing protein [Arthrobacter sp. PvP023]MBP1136547.1 quercetin dioxygenase-like cupin family protein [Arthrobacter sp. PvP023]